MVDPVLSNHHKAHAYKPGTWGPGQAAKLIAPGHWHNPELSGSATGEAPI